jgi:hypothetical protein
VIGKLAVGDREVGVIVGVDAVRELRRRRSAAPVTTRRDDGDPESHDRCGEGGVLHAANNLPRNDFE